MSTAAGIYHRTFKLIRPQSMGVMFTKDNLAKRARELEEAAKRPGYGRNPTSISARPRPAHAAFEDVGGKYSSVQLEERDDQKFNAYVTKWEQLWSRVISTSGGLRLFPVVDSNGTLIGYIGDITGNYLLITNIYGTYTYEEALKDHRMYVGTKAFFGRDDLQIFGSGLETQTYRVLTNIDGEVMAFKLSNQNTEAALTGVSLLEIAAWISLARLGVNVLVSVGTRGFRSLMRMAAKSDLKDIKVFMDKSQAALDALNKQQRRVVAGSLNPRVKGQPEVKIKVIADKEREIHAANRFANRAEWEEVHLGDEARKFYGAPEGKFPDVVARKKLGGSSIEIGLSEGKGTEIDKMIKQFEAARERILAAEKARAGGRPVTVTIGEQEVVVERLTPIQVEGGILMSPGPGFGVDKNGFLLDAQGFVDLKAGLPQLARANGQPIRVITMEYVGGPIHLP